MNQMKEEVDLVKVLTNLPRFQVDQSKQLNMLRNISRSQSCVEKPRRKKSTMGRNIAISAVCLFIISAGSLSVASARDELWNILAKFRNASVAGILTTIQFSGKNPTDPYGTESPGNFQSAESVSQLHSLFPDFPRLSLPGWSINRLLTGGQKYENGHVWIQITSNSPSITINAYHDLTRTMVIDGTTVSSQSVRTVTLDGVEAKVFMFNANGGGGNSYIVWKRDGWTLVMNTSERDTLLSLAEAFDQQFTLAVKK